MSSTESAFTVFKTRGPLDPVADHAICVPRPELDQVLRMAQAPTLDAYLAILSSRQTGKTTLLYQLRARLRPRGYGIALIDLSVVKEQPEAELYRFVAGGIRSELEPGLRSAPAPQWRGKDRESLLPSNPIEFRQFLLETARQYPAPRIVVMIDEVEAVPEKWADAFFGTIRNVFSSRRKEDEAAFDKYLFVICGSKELHRLSTGPNSPLNIAERIYLQDFTLDGVRSLAANFARAGIVAPEETAQWLYEQTTGHPYLTHKLCSLIEQWHPGVITQEMIQRATIQLLKSDDHLEKMIIQVDAERDAREVLEQLVNGKPVPFSRLNTGIARLELLGAIRDATNCAIRNPIYYTAFRAHFNAAQEPPPPRGWRRWLRPLLVIVALLFVALNVPFLYNYFTDVYGATRSINDKFASSALSSNFVIHYDRVLRTNTTEKTNISVDWDGIPINGPVEVIFQTDKPDIILEGTAQRTLDQPFQQVRFAMGLNQSGIHYNPFSPATDHRQVTLTFQSNRGNTREVYTADFVIDYYSEFVVSAALSITSLIGALGVSFGQIGHVRKILGMLGKFATQPT